MDNRHVIASSLTDNELARAFSELVAERWDSWDLMPFLTHLVDSCVPSVLPYLAEQFDVEGLQGFAVAVTEQQQRDLIKRSIALHKYIGTPWAIREACRTVGFPVVILEEGVPETPGGEAGPDDWARFRVLVEAGFDRHITAEEARKLRSFVEYYKNARSHLTELGFFQPLNDKVDIEDEAEIMYLSLFPNPAMLTGSGDVITVAVNSNVEWEIGETTLEWDGSTDKLYLSYTGKAGQSAISISSDPYVRPISTVESAYSTAYSSDYRRPDTDNYDRYKSIKIYSVTGKVLGTLTIGQYTGGNNAYSRAYSSAYNIYGN